jgi:hypothetical protein
MVCAERPSVIHGESNKHRRFESQHRREQKTGVQTTQRREPP